MARARKWYAQGYEDGMHGISDPPMHPGHKTYEDYMEGWNDADAEKDRDAEQYQRTGKGTICRS